MIKSITKVETLNTLIFKNIKPKKKSVQLLKNLMMGIHLYWYQKEECTNGNYGKCAIKC